MFTTIALLAAASLAAVWVVYPATMASIAIFRRRAPVVRPTWRPTVSVVLATRDHADAVVARVRDLLAADYDPALLEVLVACDHSARIDTRALEALCDRVHVINGDPPEGKSAALNAAVRSAKGEILVFADTHQRFAADAIRRLVEALADDSFAAMSGLLELAPERDGAFSPVGLYWRMERRLRHDEALVHSTIGVTGAIYAMRRSLWTPLPSGLILDDVLVPMRLVLNGHRVGFCSEARARETRHLAPADEFVRKVRTQTGVLQLCAWTTAVLSPVRNPVWAQFLVHKLLRLLTPYGLLVVLAWACSGVIRMLVAKPFVAFALAALLLLSFMIGASRPLVSAGKAVLWGLVMQAAILVATAHGLRGRWNVWRA